jgi:hypothetical protein
MMVTALRLRAVSIMRMSPHTHSESNVRLQVTPPVHGRNSNLGSAHELLEDRPPQEGLSRKFEV